jgi:hypothetical protein
VKCVAGGFVADLRLERGGILGGLGMAVGIGFGEACWVEKSRRKDLFSKKVYDAPSFEGDLRLW